MTEYQNWEHGILEDVSHDTDAIIRMLGGHEKMESYDSGLIAGMLNNRGIDPGILALLDRDKKDGMLGDNGLVLLFLILLLGGGNGFGFGARGQAGMDAVSGVDRTVVNEANYSRLLDAVAGNREAVAGLAQTLNCDVQSINNALCGLDKQLALSQGSIINAIQSCCCTMQSKIDECCCRTNLNIERGNNAVQQSIQDVRFLVSSSQAAQDNLIQSQFAAQNAYLAQQFCDLRMNDMQAENLRLRDQLARQSQDAQTALLLNAIANKDSISFSGTAGTTAFTGTGSLS